MKGRSHVSDCAAIGLGLSCSHLNLGISTALTCASVPWTLLYTNEWCSAGWVPFASFFSFASHLRTPLDPQVDLLEFCLVDLAVFADMNLRNNKRFAKRSGHDLRAKRFCQLLETYGGRECRQDIDRGRPSIEF